MLNRKLMLVYMAVLVMLSFTEAGENVSVTGKVGYGSED